MKPEMETLVKQFIALPLALKVFKRDREIFSDWKMRNVYLDKLDAAMGSIQSDLNEVKRQMYSEHHIRVTTLKPKGDIFPYQWKTTHDEGVIEFSSDELRELTKITMREYLFSSPPRPPGAEDRAWY